MKIVWLSTALQNLEDESSFIAETNPQAAAEVVKAIFKSVDNLADHPSLGRPGRVDGTRELIVPNTAYIVPYRVKPRANQIQILRIFHASRRLPRSWS